MLIIKCSHEVTHKPITIHFVLLRLTTSENTSSLPCISGGNLPCSRAIWFSCSTASCNRPSPVQASTCINANNELYWKSEGPGLALFLQFQFQSCHRWLFIYKWGVQKIFFSIQVPEIKMFFQPCNFSEHDVCIEASVQTASSLNINLFIYGYLRKLRLKGYNVPVKF